jgi:hypothetical protein
MPDYRRRAAGEAMSVRLDVNGMIADTVGGAGVARREVEMLATGVAKIAVSLKARFFLLRPGNG